MVEGDGMGEGGRGMKALWWVEVTDMFGGEANYSWVTRHVIKAKSKRGAIYVLSRRSGIKWRNNGYLYLSRSGCTCAFVEEYDQEIHGGYLYSTDARERK